MQSYSKSTYPTDTPYFMVDNGYSDKKYHNCGIEFIFQKTSDEPFRLPLEVSTSLGLNESLWGDNNPYAENTKQSTDEPSTLEISPHLAERGQAQIAAKGTTFPPMLELVNSWEIQRELIKRYKMKLLNLFRSG